MISHLGLKIKLSECPIGPDQVQKTQNAMPNCLFALGPYISPMTNVLLTDLGLSIPLSYRFRPQYSFDTIASNLSEYFNGICSIKIYKVNSR